MPVYTYSIEGATLHYFKFNINDWRANTAHLTPVEESIYLRLISYYYDSETGIDAQQLKVVARKCRLSGFEEEMGLILDEFFSLVDGVYIHSRVDLEIDAYHANAERARSNGKKGGRPRANPPTGGDQTQSEPKTTPDKNPEITQSVSTENPDGYEVGTQKKTNHKPLTTNQELITNNQDTKSEKRFSFKAALLELGAPEQLASDWLKVRKAKRAANTQTALKGFLNEVQKSGRTLNDVLQQCVEQSWGGFKSDWASAGGQKVVPLSPKSMSTTDLVNDRSWA
jgi:uncharacterized protein YdaU (DUF1376 family)